jgi:hypothetical protein
MYGHQPVRRLRAVGLPEAEKLRRSFNRTVTFGRERIRVSQVELRGAFFHRTPQVIVEVTGYLDQDKPEVR